MLELGWPLWQIAARRPILVLRMLQLATTSASPPSATNPWVERAKINLAWLHKMRWAAIASQLATIIVVRWGMDIELPISQMLSVIALAAVSNIGLGQWLRAGQTSWLSTAGRGQWLAGSLMMLDNLFLTVLLYYTGGPSNPFTVFYLVNIALAAAVLPARWAWTLDAAAFLCFALLFFVHVSLSALEHGPEHEHAMHHHTRTAPGPMSLHLQGSLVAFGAAATFIVYFITRVTSELARRDAELDEARQRKAQYDKLDALGTLAAGAAHELASPLSTIAVLVRDLELTLEQGVLDDEAIADTRLIRSEVDRCRRILDSMASTAGESVGEAWQRTTTDELLRTVFANTAAGDRLEMTVDPRVASRSMRLPKLAVCQALRAVVQNALQVSPAEDRVQVVASADEEGLSITVTDAGPGMSDDVRRRAGEPFFTTKEPGSGMGLGLFLARRVVERLGGNLSIQSQLGAGTTVTIQLPADAAREVAAS